MCGLDTLRKLYVDVHLDWSLRISHNKIDLVKSPTENDAKNDHKSNCKPCHNRCVGLKIIHSVDLLSAVEVQPGLVQLDLICCEVTFALHRPYRRYNLDVFRNFASLLEGSILAIHVSVDFLDNSLHKFLCIRLSECLLKIRMSPTISAWNAMGFCIHS